MANLKQFDDDISRAKVIICIVNRCFVFNGLFTFLIRLKLKFILLSSPPIFIASKNSVSSVALGE